jgi:hypothetical protein
MILKHLKTLFPLIVLSILSLSANGQDGNIALGNWRTHMPFNHIDIVEETPGKMWAAGEKGFFYSDFENLEAIKGSKSDGFAEINVSYMSYNNKLDILLLAYENTNIDLVQGNTIINIEDIKRKTINGAKKINHVYFNGNYAYLSCSFGLIVLDIVKIEIKDSYLNIGEIGESINVNSCTIFGDSIYIATDKGIRKAKNSSTLNLNDFNNWSYFTNTPCHHLVTYNNKLIADQDSVAQAYSSNSWVPVHSTEKKDIVNIKICHEKLVVADKKLILVEDNTGKQTEHIVNGINYALIDKNNIPWFGINTYGLIQKLPNIEYSYSPKGPYSFTSFDMLATGDQIWVSGGGIGSNNGPAYSPTKYSIYEDNQWLDYAGGDTLIRFNDMNFLSKNPRNGNIFLGSFSNGLLEFKGTNLVNYYGEDNSVFKPWAGSGSSTIVPEVAFDNSGNMWACNYGIDSGLVVRKANGDWKKFYLNGAYLVMRPMVDYNGYIWMTAFEESSKQDKGIIVFDPSRTIDVTTDDRYIVLKNAVGSGNLPSEGINCLHQNETGDIWIGSDNGLSVIYNPRNIFNGEDAQRIIIEQDGEAGYLLGSEVIYCIEDDGSGRKWIGTNLGAWLISENGSEVLEHFTAENSPLLSDKVFAVAIHEITGEVFFGTSEGIVSFRGSSSKAQEFGNKMKIFPNPVKPDFSGLVSISGLPYNSTVKITDINGMAIYETKANGGTAVWNATTFDGTRPATGVYLVFAINEDGKKTLSGKIFFIH